MRSLALWIQASRPRTLVAIVCPVAIGTALSLSEGTFHPITFLFTLLTALGIQISTNLANDYFDFLKGADTINRKGPARVTQSGLISLAQMKLGIVFSLVFTALFGIYLIWQGGVVIGFLVALSLLLAVGYTAGPFPLAYLGLGDLFVLIFYGPIAVEGTYYLQTGLFSLEALSASIAPGALASAILILNNLRDIEEDRLAKKKTLPVRFGRLFGKFQYLCALLLALSSPLLLSTSHPLVLLTTFFFFPATHLIFCVFKNTDPLALNSLFYKTGQLTLLYTLLFCITWML